MTNYNQTTQEITRPSDLLAGIRSYTASMHSLSSYINVDVTRLVKSVLLQQTQPLDSHGGVTVTHYYTTWWVWAIQLLAKVFIPLKLFLIVLCYFH